MTTSKNRSGAQVLVDALSHNKTERIFCIPGESYLAALDALYDHSEIDLIICRNEGGASYMAEADGKMTGRPGVCFVTRGPGATNASGGLHIAMQDSTPMILLIGQIARKDIDREAFQEIDYRRMFSEVAKWVAQIDDANRIPEYLNRAFATATSGRPGPVVLALPEDMLTDLTNAPDAREWIPVVNKPSEEDIDAVCALLDKAKNPLIIIGGSDWHTDTGKYLEKFAETFQIPVLNSLRCQDYFNNFHPNYAGDLGLGVNPEIISRVKKSDCLLVVGSRMGEMTTGGFTLLDIPNPQQVLIHVHSGAEELGSIYQPDLAIHCDSDPFIKAISQRSNPTKHSGHRAQMVKQANESYLSWTNPVTNQGSIQMAQVMRHIEEKSNTDSILCNGAGNNTIWLHRFYRFQQYGCQLAPTSGTMGYGVPAAISAKLRHPEKTVIAIAGDGDFMMNGQELATALQYGVKIIIILVNNGTYATIRMHQERHYPSRVIGTDMVNPDFVALAKAYGASGESIESTEAFESAFDRALQSERSYLIELMLDPEVLTPTLTISDLRQS